jgi:hypothetical protein
MFVNDTLGAATDALREPEAHKSPLSVRHKPLAGVVLTESSFDEP